MGLFPERIVATQGGLSFGEPAAALPADPARYQGRLTGHLLWDRRRFAVAGDATFELTERNGELHLTGRIEGVVLQPLGPRHARPRRPARAVAHAHPRRRPRPRRLVGRAARQPRRP